MLEETREEVSGTVDLLVRVKRFSTEFETPLLKLTYESISDIKISS